MSDSVKSYFASSTQDVKHNVVVVALENCKALHGELTSTKSNLEATADFKERVFFLCTVAVPNLCSQDEDNPANKPEEIDQKML